MVAMVAIVVAIMVAIMVAIGDMGTTVTTSNLIKNLMIKSIQERARITKAVTWKLTCESDSRQKEGLAAWRAV
ncbi:hypothetical protein CU098_011535 [Rhizopus stolonifer]|uniref:Uncharacterized protein n=1 Tax=Rhizopus stolonifer TaxID=4846 RepID=A0A367KII3_RHIST|nr:hypothetical protein CU098_011535 [Rhizopus stolonifer]